MENPWDEAFRKRWDEATERYRSYNAHELRNALEVAMLKGQPEGHLLYIEERALLDVVHQRMRNIHGR